MGFSTRDTFGACGFLFSTCTSALYSWMCAVSLLPEGSRLLQGPARGADKIMSRWDSGQRSYLMEHLPFYLTPYNIVVLSYIWKTSFYLVRRRGSNTLTWFRRWVHIFYMEETDILFYAFLYSKASLSFFPVLKEKALLNLYKINHMTINQLILYPHTSPIL